MSGGYCAAVLVLVVLVVVGGACMLSSRVSEWEGDREGDWDE